jgi:ribosome-binding factor A
MSQRTEKVASLVHQIVATELTQLPGAAHLTVTGVEVAPDLRQATIWIGVLAPGDNDARAAQLFAVATEARDQLQAAVARQLTTKFVPRLTLQRDVGGAYADRMTRLIRGL